MDRKDFIKLLGLIPLSAVAMKLDILNSIVSHGEETDKMPMLFVGHGSPMNAIEDNIFSQTMKKIGTEIPKPKAILMVSAHWETKGTKITGQLNPPTIHDFGGFPQALFDVQYPAPGSEWLVGETTQLIKTPEIHPDVTWGFDHGAWSVTKNLFPLADIPMIQLSLDYTQGPQYHYDLGKQLNALRKKGVLIIGSGNMVHNFQYLQVKGPDFNAPFGHDWALEANEFFKSKITSNDHQPLIDYSKQSKAIKLSIPTPEHYLPLLYVLAGKEESDKVSFFNDMAIAGSFTMTSVKIG